jgi:hypothetical protein
MINLTQTVNSLKPNAQWVLRGDELEWLDTEQTEPTDIEIQTELARLMYLEGVNTYQQERVYLPITEQLDILTKDGLEALQTINLAVKAEVPKVLPVQADEDAYVKEHVGTYVFNKQLKAYTSAVARLDKYILADGRAEVTEMMDTTEYVVDEEGMIVLTDDEPTFIQEEVITVSAVEPLESTVEITVYSEEDMEAEPTVETIENPEITQDNLERTEAQAVVDTTPSEVGAFMNMLTESLKVEDVEAEEA